jgi:threonine aldolase
VSPTPTPSPDPALPPPPEVSFASDNTAGVAPAVMAALAEANTPAAGAYGDDPWSEALTDRFAELLGRPVEVLACWGGTGANVVGLASLLGSWQAVLCAESAHIVTDECGAPARFTGALLLTDPGEDGKLTPAAVERRLEWLGDQHHPQPGVVSISQVTELGTVYTAGEIAALADAAHAAGRHRHRPAGHGGRHGRGRPHVGGHQERGHVRRGGGAAAPRAGPPRPVRAQAGGPAPLQGPLRGRPAAGAARR